ncbi:MAG: hypothetical protein ACKN9U_14690 [Pirellulaceae bacterium]
MPRQWRCGDALAGAEGHVDALAADEVTKGATADVAGKRSSDRKAIGQ